MYQNGDAMRKATLSLLLAVVSNNAAAEWVKVADTEVAAIYTDPAAVRKTENTVQIWVLFDLKSAVAVPESTPFMSSKAQYEYDCKEDRVRGHFYTLHAASMAGGEVVGKNYGPTDWMPVASDSLNQALWKIACEK